MAFTHTISRPQRGHELSEVVVGAILNPALRGGVGGGICTPPPYSPGRLILIEGFGVGGLATSGTSMCSLAAERRDEP